MKRLFGIALVAAALVVAVVSCSDNPRVIPTKKMEKIYREMFLADEWLMDTPGKKEIADTTWFYKPIFEKYGYDLDDYIKSVDYYLNDPKRYADMLGRVSKSLEDEATGINRVLDKREAMRHKADSIAQAMKAFAPDDFSYYGDLFYVTSMTDRIDIRKNARGVYFPVPVTEDTLFHGPELIIRDSTVVPEPSERLPIPWKE